MRTFWCISAVFALSACSGSSDRAPPAHGFQLKTPAYTLPAGQEQYLCYTVKLDEADDVAITAFDSFTSEQVHHLEVFQALAPEADGLNPCDGTVKVTWLPLFGGGQNAGGLKLPDGAGFKLPKDAQLLVQLHLLNATTKDVQQKVVINMDYAADPGGVTPAGIFAFGSMEINLPPQSQGTQVVSSCQLPKALDVFAVQPHMHTRGTKVTFDVGASEDAAQTVYQRNPWVFGAQPIDAFQMPMTQGQFGRVTCTYDNTSDKAITYGESTEDEMCYLVLFYTPFDRLGGCVN
jgi:hypothetical protein